MQQRDTGRRRPRPEARAKEPSARRRAAPWLDDDDREAVELARRLRPKPPRWRAPGA